MVNKAAVRKNDTVIIKIVTLGSLPPPYGGPAAMMETLLKGLRQNKK
jgi:hypothetical protein